VPQGHRDTNANKWLDVTGSNFANGTRLQIWTCTGGAKSEDEHPKTQTRAASWGFGDGSGHSSVLVDHATKDGMATHRRAKRDEDGGVVVGCALLAALVRSVFVEVLGELVKNRDGMAFSVDQHGCNSDRTLRTNLSA
jgi:hypothetical protein